MGSIQFCEAVLSRFSFGDVKRYGAEIDKQAARLWEYGYDSPTKAAEMIRADLERTGRIQVWGPMTTDPAI